MKHKMFSVYDQAAHAYLPPFILHSDALAARIFGDCVNASDHQFAKHPGDYALYRIGSFDDAACKLEAEVPIHLVTTGIMAKVPASRAGNGELFPELGEAESALIEHVELKGGDL